MDGDQNHKPYRTFDRTFFSILPDFQVCQETCPESSEGPIPSNLDLNMESQPPVIHDIVTSSPSDNEQLEATPFVTSINLGVPLDIPTSVLPPAEAEEPSILSAAVEGPAPEEQPTDVHAGPAAAAEEIPVDVTMSEAEETLAAGAPPCAPAKAVTTITPERTEPLLLTDDRPAADTLGSEETEEETMGEKEDMEQSEIQDEMEEEEEEEEEGRGWISRLSLN